MKIPLIALTLLATPAFAGELHTAELENLDAAKLISNLAAAGVPVKGWNQARPLEFPGTEIELKTGKIVCREPILWGKGPTLLNGRARCEGRFGAEASYILLQAISGVAARNEVSEPGVVIVTVESVDCKVRKGDYGWVYNCKVQYGDNSSHE